MPQYGSNQVFEQLFQAHEQRLNGKAERQFYEKVGTTGSLVCLQAGRAVPSHFSKQAIPVLASGPFMPAFLPSHSFPPSCSPPFTGLCGPAQARVRVPRGEAPGRVLQPHAAGAAACVVFLLAAGSFCRSTWAGPLASRRRSDCCLFSSPRHLVEPAARCACGARVLQFDAFATTSPAHGWLLPAPTNNLLPLSLAGVSVAAAVAVWRADSLPLSLHESISHLSDQTDPFSPLVSQEFSLRWLWDSLPLFLFYAFGVSFLGVALAIGIFRPRKQMPVDMFQVGGWCALPWVLVFSSTRLLPVALPLLVCASLCGHVQPWHQQSQAP